jgi:hypothetical protein
MQLMHAFGKGQDRSRWSMLFKEIRDTLRLLPDVKIGHVRTKQNQVAHGIAPSSYVQNFTLCPG